MEEYYMDDRAMEQASLQMLISQAGDLSDVQAEQRFLEAQLSLMQSKLQRAQTEVELLSDAIQYLTESNTSECSRHIFKLMVIDTAQAGLWEVLSRTVAHLLSSMNT
jgi:hypothetical protein